MKYIIFWILLFNSQLVYTQDLIPFRDGGKWGYSDRNGNILVNPEFEEAQLFEISATGVKKNGKYAIINENGILCTDFIFNEIGFWGYGFLYGIKNDEQKKCYTTLGREVECLYGCGTTGRALRVSRFRTYKEREKIGIYINQVEKDILGTERVRYKRSPAIWDDFIENYNGFAAVKKDDKWGVINRESKLIIDYKYDNIEVDKTKKLLYRFKVELNGKFGFLDENVNELIPPKYFNADFFNLSLAKVWINPDFWFYIDTDGNEYYKK